MRITLSPVNGARPEDLYRTLFDLVPNPSAAETMGVRARRVPDGGYLEFVYFSHVQIVTLTCLRTSDTQDQYALEAIRQNNPGRFQGPQALPAGPAAVSKGDGLLKRLCRVNRTVALLPYLYGLGYPVVVDEPTYLNDERVFHPDVMLYDAPNGQLWNVLSQRVIARLDLSKLVDITINLITEQPVPMLEVVVELQDVVHVEHCLHYSEQDLRDVEREVDLLLDRVQSRNKRVRRLTTTTTIWQRRSRW
jgi:hypothetical protein